MAALACGLLLGGCTDAPEPLPPLPTAAHPTAVTPSTAAPPPGPTTSLGPTSQAPDPQATTPPPANPATTPAFQELRATLELFTREQLQAGAGAVIIQAKVGPQEWTHAAGTSRETGAASRPEDQFAVGGVARTMVAVTVMKLVEEGRLRLDDPLALHLPDAPADQPTATPATVRQLLSEAPTLPASQRADDVLGVLVERLRGAPLQAVLDTDILIPLGMRSTVMLGTAVSDGIDSTVTDINLFHAGLLKGRLVSAGSLIDMKGAVFAQYGLGLDHWDDRCTNGYYYGHSGDVPGFGTITISSADGNRQLTISVARPVSPQTTQPSALVLEMTGVAQVALNSGCRFQFR